jgi:gliding motility-associated-like protein
MSTMRTILTLAFLVICTGLLAQKSSGDVSGTTTEELQVWAPNAFTPNFDGMNDVWRVTVGGPQLDLYEVVVIDRSGSRVFYSTDPTEVWTGNTRNGEYLSNPAMFVYFIKAKVVGNTEVKTYRGHITMIR